MTKGETTLERVQFLVLARSVMLQQLNDFDRELTTLGITTTTTSRIPSQKVIIGGEVTTEPMGLVKEPKGKRKMSTAARKRIAEASRARWAAYRKTNGKNGKIRAA